MRILSLFLWAAMMFMIGTQANAQSCAGYVYPLQHGKKYLQISGYKGELIELFTKPDFQGEAPMFLAKRGLFFNDKVLCTWAGTPDEQGYNLFDDQNAVNMVFEYCPVDSPVQATWGDRGVGTAVIYILIKERIADYIITEFRGQNFYLDMRKIPSNVHTEIIKFDATVNLEPEDEPVQEWKDPGFPDDAPTGEPEVPTSSDKAASPDASSVDIKESNEPKAPVNPTPKTSRDPELNKPKTDANPKAPEVKQDKKSETTTEKPTVI